jgi:hypothetical protein
MGKQSKGLPGPPRPLSPDQEDMQLFRYLEIILDIAQEERISFTSYIKMRAINNTLRDEWDNLRGKNLFAFLLITSKQRKLEFSEIRRLIRVLKLGTLRLGLSAICRLLENVVRTCKHMESNI